MVNNKPLITVVVPVYNKEKYINQCIDTILAQTYKNLEIILVDDGSPDKCPEICDEYATKDKRIKVIHQKNSGLSATRNVGLEIGKGQYISFIDSDDYIEPDMLEYLYDLISRDNAGMAICNMCEDVGYHTKRKIDKPYMFVPGTEAFKYSAWVYATNRLYRRDFIGDLRYDTTTAYGEDILFNFELMKLNAPVALGSQAKYHYRCEPNNGASIRVFNPKYLRKIELMDECIKYAKEHNLTLFYKRASNAQVMHASRWLWQIACSNTEDPKSVKFLTDYARKHFIRLLSADVIGLSQKLFVICACVNFNLARKILLFCYSKKAKK